MGLTRLAYQAININPNNNLPGTAQIAALVGGLVTWVLYACGAAILLGAGAWGLGHQAGNYNAEHKGRSMALGGVIGAMVAGAASALVNFGFGVGGSVH
jgi:hypothetical protein